MEFGRLQSEALTLKYIPKLIYLKDFIFKSYNILTLENIYKYPLDMDESLISFYEKILFVLSDVKDGIGIWTRNQYFVRKKSLKYINGCIFYEYVLDASDDKTNKFNTFVCYSLKNIRFEYDLKLLLLKKEISFLNTKISINIILDYEYSIRPCTFKNLLYLININVEDGKRDKDYKIIMDLIKYKNISLVNIIDENFSLKLSPNGYYSKFFNYLKEFIQSDSLGVNTIRYLLLDMRNNIIKVQMYRPRRDMPETNNKFNDLRIHLGTKAFELMPYAYNPKEARTSLNDLFDLFDVCEDELLYRYISEYINQNNTLFVKHKDLGYSESKFLELVKLFNKKLIRNLPYYSNYKIIEKYGYYTIESYYEMTKNVINLSKKLCQMRNLEVENDYSTNEILKENQKNILSKMFLKSSIELVTGSAGTGKTTVIKEFIKNNGYRKFLCLTTTNTANNNLKINDDEIDIEYKNIAQFEREKEHCYYDVIIVDEASFVSTKSIELILSTYQKSIFLIVGDPNQIESIEFGNWFSLLLDILKSYNVINILDIGLRTNVKELSNIWKTVKEGKKDDILELLSAYDMTEKLNEDILAINENEVVLCLNYDGLYGINNINRYLQASNKNVAYEYQQNLYKIGDPVVFVINDYSEYGIYNNLKGKIIDIKEADENISFKIEIFDDVNYTGYLSNELFIEKQNNTYYAIVEKTKFYSDKYDSDMNIRTKLPFQISYAMSIHKAQGLEFDSVKIVITKEADELISKNIFYTAITRAKKNLKIYWEPEVANFVLDNLEKESGSNKVDLSLFK